MPQTATMSRMVPGREQCPDREWEFLAGKRPHYLLRNSGIGLLNDPFSRSSNVRLVGFNYSQLEVRAKSIRQLQVYKKIGLI